MSKVTATPIPIPPPPEDIPVLKLTLELSRKDAYGLAWVCSFIGGAPQRSPRGVFNAISQSLRDRGVAVPCGGWQSTMTGGPVSLIALEGESVPRGLYFKEYDKFNLPCG